MREEQLLRRIALVTGGRRGIGRAIVLRLARAGAAVVVGAQDARDEGLEATVAEVRAFGGRAQSLVCDLAVPDARGDAIARASALFGPIDILVNNAAINNHAPPSIMDPGYRRQLFEVNLHAPIDLVQQVLPQMHVQGWGRILAVSSATAQQPTIPYPGPAEHAHGTAVYGAGKAALDRFVRGLATELHGSGITANAIYPTAVCVTGANSPAARAALRGHPELGEGVEMMAEAAMLLIRGSLTGLVLPSREVLAMHQAPLHALDGQTIVGDADTLAALD